MATGGRPRPHTEPAEALWTVYARLLRTAASSDDAALGFAAVFSTSSRPRSGSGTRS